MNAEEWGKQAYQKMLGKQHKDAIRILSQAIHQYPDDRRFYTNRCNCYIQLEDFDRALMDAMHLTDHYPDYPKGYYLEGEISYLLKDYKDAETKFQRVADMLPNNEEVQNRLFDSQLKQVLKKGYHIDVAQKALRITSSVEEAIQGLSLGLISKVKGEKTEFYLPLSDEEENHLLRAFERLEQGEGWQQGNSSDAKPSVVVVTKPKTMQKLDPRMDPANPLKSKSLYLGNISDSVKERHLRSVFSKFGDIQSVNIHPDKKCAFVNFTKPEAAGKALKECNGLCLEGIHIHVRFPDSILKK